MLRKDEGILLVPSFLSTFVLKVCKTTAPALKFSSVSADMPSQEGKMTPDFPKQNILKSRENKRLQNVLTTPRRRSFRKINLEMADRFGRWLSAQKYSSSTQERYCRIARKLCQHIGKKALSSVTPMDVGDYLTRSLPSHWGDTPFGPALRPQIVLRFFIPRWCSRQRGTKIPQIPCSDEGSP